MNLIQTIKKTGLFSVIIAILIFISTLFLGNYKLEKGTLEQFVDNNSKKYAVTNKHLSELYGREYTSFIQFLYAIKHKVDASSEDLKDWVKEDKVHHSSGQTINNYEEEKLIISLVKSSTKGNIAENRTLLLFLTFGLGIIGGLMFILPNLTQLPGIKNNNIFKEKGKKRDWLSYLTAAIFILFYIFLYFYPIYISNWIYLLDPVSYWFSGSASNQWFFYGFLYTIMIAIMGVRMLIKYRHSNYQKLRTLSVMFFQTIFAFLLPQILKALNQPSIDLKNFWPLDYTFFFQWRIYDLWESGGLGIFMFFWGTLSIFITIPILTYFYGKRWYCSWVCGCGGLAETLGDPYRQLSDKSLKAWKIERYLVYGVLGLAVIMTVITLLNLLFGGGILGALTNPVQRTYGFLIGSIFSGVVGTGFYPLMGNRVWCRYGCPLAAYMGIVQRFKSRFRITVNGGQCISCGNCSTYCEMGIDVRSYAQRGVNIVRASCVGCGVCEEVCPRGVLKLENGSEKTRFNSELKIETEGFIVNNK